MLSRLSNVSYSHPPSIPTVCPHLKRVACRYPRRTAGRGPDYLPESFRPYAATCKDPFPSSIGPPMHCQKFDGDPTLWNLSDKDARNASNRECIEFFDCISSCTFFARILSEASCTRFFVFFSDRQKRF